MLEIGNGGMSETGDASAKVASLCSDFGMKGSHSVRDFWAHADRGKFTDEYAAEVPSHGVIMVTAH